MKDRARVRGRVRARVRLKARPITAAVAPSQSLYAMGSEIGSESTCQGCINKVILGLGPGLRSGQRVR